MALLMEATSRAAGRRTKSSSAAEISSVFVCFFRCQFLICFSARESRLADAEISISSARENQIRSVLNGMRRSKPHSQGGAAVLHSVTSALCSGSPHAFSLTRPPHIPLWQLTLEPETGPVLLRIRAVSAVSAAL